MVEKRGKYGVLDVGTVRSLNGQFVRECKDELMRKGEFSKGFKVPAKALHDCIKRKWLEFKKSYKG